MVKKIRTAVGELAQSVSQISGCEQFVWEGFVEQVSFWPEMEQRRSDGSKSDATEVHELACVNYGEDVRGCVFVRTMKTDHKASTSFEIFVTSNDTFTQCRR